jgi:hypothetical protein
MRKAIIYILTMFSLISCNSKMYDAKDVQEIEITSLRKESVLNKVRFTDFKDIKQIIDEVNKSKKEPIKFVADYKLIIKLKDTSRTLLIRNSMMNIEGITYELNNNLGNIIDEKLSKATN